MRLFSEISSHSFVVNLYLKDHMKNYKKINKLIRKIDKLLLLQLNILQ